MNQAPALVICGAGLHAGQLTLEALAALKSCEVVFCVNLPEELAEALRVLLPRARPLAYAGSGRSRRPERELCGSIERLWPRRRDAGVVLSGHPLLFSAGAELIRHCRRRRWPYRVVCGVSSVGAALAAAERALPPGGLELYGGSLAVRDAAEVARGAVDPRETLVVLNAFRGDWRRLTAALRRRLPPGRRAVLVECAPAGGADRCRTATVAGLSRLRAPSSQTTLILPGRPA